MQADRRTVGRGRRVGLAELLDRPVAGVEANIGSQSRCDPTEQVASLDQWDLLGGTQVLNSMSARYINKVTPSIRQ